MFELSKSITLRALAGVAAANPHPETNPGRRRHATQTNSTMATEIARIRVPTTRATERRQSRVASRAAKQIESETNRPNSSPMLWHLQSLNIQLSLWRRASIAAGKDRDPRPSEAKRRPPHHLSITRDHWRYSAGRLRPEFVRRAARSIWPRANQRCPGCSNEILSAPLSDRSETDSRRRRDELPLRRAP